MGSMIELFRSSPSRGVLARGRLAHWEELLEEWCLIHERYRRVVEDDAIYWNGERANIAAVAAAAWRCGWVALEEFPQSKRERRSRGFGRADLYVQSSRRSWEYVEAKFDYIYVTATEHRMNWFQKAFRAALSDARKLHLSSRGDKRVGIALASVYLPKEDQRPPMELFGNLFANLDKEQFDAAAWCFPPVARTLEWKDPGGTHLYPGVVLLGKVTGRGDE